MRIRLVAVSLLVVGAASAGSARRPARRPALCVPPRSREKQDCHSEMRGASRSSHIVRLALLGVMFALAWVSLGCDPGWSVRIENRTAQNVAVYEDGQRIDLLPPGETRNYAVLKFTGRRIYQVKTPDGEVLSEREFT